MPPRWQRAFQAIFPSVVIHLGVALLFLLFLLFPFGWYIKLPLALISMVLLIYVGGLLYGEYQQQELESPPLAEFVPLEPLDDHE